MLYCEAKLFRAGLTNRLFPWARCRIYSHLHGMPMLTPCWAQVPFGTILRREADLRTYTNLFIRRDGDISGWRRAYVRLRAKKVTEPERLTDDVPYGDGMHVVVFEGMKEQFQPLRGWHELVRQELLTITRRDWREKAEAVPGRFIGIHVRRGDFQRPGVADLSRVDNTCTPLAWFVESLKAVRARISATVPAIVTSDGSPNELHALLTMENVRLVSTGSAIGDLLVLSRAVLLLASGSSFSAWASYLGQMPTLSHPEQSLMRLFRLGSSTGRFVGGFDPSDAPVAFFDSLNVRL
jgi:Glycosyl transferase family 11